jgi:hypothetical protein
MLARRIDEPGCSGMAKKESLYEKFLRVMLFLLDKRRPGADLGTRA